MDATGASHNLLTCAMCGQRFDPAQAVACQGCPLQKGCQLVRCPACGFEMVDPRRSTLARLAQRLFVKETKTTEAKRLS